MQTRLYRLEFSNQNAFKLQGLRGMHFRKTSWLLLLYFFQYKATDFVVPSPGKLELVYKPANGGEPVVYEVHNFTNGGGVAMGMYNTDEVGIPVHSSYCILLSSHYPFIHVVLFQFP